MSATKLQVLIHNLSVDNDDGNNVVVDAKIDGEDDVNKFDEDDEKIYFPKTMTYVYFRLY